MSTDQSAQGVSTESVLKTADLLPVFAIAGLGKGVAADACDMLRALVSERDALASRVRALEGERDRLTLSKIDRECLRIGQEIQRAAGELPDGYEIGIEVERGAGSVYLSKPDYSTVGFHDMVDGLSHAITQAIDAALTTTSGDSHE